MRLSDELREALTDDMVGFSEDELAESFVAMIDGFGFSGSDEDLVLIGEAIDEFFEEEDALLESLWKSLAKAGLKSLSKSISKIDTKSSVGKKLKDAAAGAASQMAKDPSKAKEILKKSAGKLKKKAVKKGMKMVFGRWVDVGKPGKSDDKSDDEPKSTEPKKGKQVTKKPVKKGKQATKKPVKKGKQVKKKTTKKAEKKPAKKTAAKKTTKKTKASPKKEERVMTRLSEELQTALKVVDIPIIGEMSDARFDDMVSHIAKLTDHNDHNGALLYLADTMMNNRKLAGAVRAVSDLHAFYGHMPSGLMKVRDDLYKAAMDTAKKKFSKEQYEKIHGAF